MSNNPFFDGICNKLSEIGFNVENMSSLHRYPADTSERVLKELLMFACCTTHIGFISWGRHYIQKINREWRLEHILESAKECLDFSDDWEYRRFLELVDLSAFELLQDVILIGKDSDNPEIKEASQDFREYYERLSAHPDDNFRDQILKAVLNGEKLRYLAEIAHKFKSLGMDREHMYELLESLRSETKNVTQEEQIFELMDLMFGYCHPDMRIF
ncbi:MAG: hypothetical protein J5643_02585 [Lachnospiraceae bacterium]|nr:hypothetical protein [Lachnospiraceae bacterium]MBR5677965.1 hypothetical protein [Paludibacteraceae bacterium]